MTSSALLSLLVPSFLAGALNSVAGGGSFLTFPSLLWAGLGPVAANATSTVALWPGSLASALGYRQELGSVRAQLVWMGLPSLVGGLLGARLLVITPPEVFLRIVPWLLLIATVAFTFGSRARAPVTPTSARALGKLGAALVQLAIATYGGYFGGGIGLMMLATFAWMRLTDLHAMNALKCVLAAAINGVAIALFVSSGLVEWPPAAVMTVGAIAGGYAGAAVARRLPVASVRLAIVAYGWLLTAYFFFEHG